MFDVHVLQYFPRFISPCLLWVWLPIQTVLQLTTSQADVAVTVRKTMTKSFTYYCIFCENDVLRFSETQTCHDVYSTPVIVCLVSARGVMVIKGISNWDRFVDSKLVDMLISGGTDGWNLLGRGDRNGKRRNRPVWSAWVSALSARGGFDSRWTYGVKCTI